MTSRILPPAEWARLAGTELEHVWPSLRPDAIVVVVEDADGAIVACWSLFACLHAEGVWIAPAHRKRGSVAGRLLRAMFQAARGLGATSIVTAATTPDVAALIGKLRGVALPGTAYIVPIGER